MREREPAWQQINASLERLQTDRLDLIQLHAVGDLDELDKVTRPGGSLEAAVRAVDEGLAGAVGITGHGHTAPAHPLGGAAAPPVRHGALTDQPALWNRPDYRSDYEALVAEVRRQDVGLMTIKTVSRRNWPEGAGPDARHVVRAAVDPERIRAAVSWGLARPRSPGSRRRGTSGCWA